MTVTLGAFAGAIDLWHLRVNFVAVPLAHHRSHGLTQIFGFVWLFTAGISLQLLPRFMGRAPASRNAESTMWWAGVLGVLGLVIAQIGGAFAWVGLLGALLLVVSMTRWAVFVARTMIGAPVPRDGLFLLLAGGTAWWWLAAMSVLFNAVAVVRPAGWLVFTETTYALGVVGGGCSWLWGVFHRAGLCTLQLRAPALGAQRKMAAIWHTATTVLACATLIRRPWADAAAGLAMAVAVGTVWATFKPWQSFHLRREPLLAPHAIRLGLCFVGVFGALSGYGAFGALGLPAPALIGDAARHALSLGGVCLVTLGFAGRMVPGFSGTTLRWRAAFNLGVIFIAVGCTARLFELAGSSSWALRLSGGSGGLAFVGVLATASALLRTLWPKKTERPRPSWLPIHS